MKFSDYISAKPSLRNVLETFSSVRLPAGLLLAKLPLLHPRQYSISSTIDVKSGFKTLDITVGVLEYTTTCQGRIDASLT